MADAGKIGFTLKNEYDNATPYEYLDVVTHNNITIKVSNEAINDPEAVNMGSGATFSAQEAMVSAQNNPTISSVTRALQRMGATPKDMIAILETMKKAGAFHADLEII